jgi:hypothetical protein
MSSDRHQRAWQAAARLLSEREQKLREMAAQWQQGMVPFQALMELKDEVHALLDLERELFRKAFPGAPQFGGKRR